MTIVGICLFQNEDIYLSKVLDNVAGFCDKMILLDNRSADSSLEIAKEACRKYSHYELYKIKSPASSHGFIEEYAGTDTWVFGVDGDEIYDPEGLLLFKKELLSKYQDRWQIYGNVLHATKIEREKQQVSGYLARPSRSMTKLYNFSLIESWKNCQEERLHGGTLKFKNQKSQELFYAPCDVFSWEESIFRCVHAVFVKRSSLQKNSHARLNIYDKNHLAWWKKLLSFRNASAKHNTYKRGELVQKKIDWL